MKTHKKLIYVLSFVPPLGLLLKVLLRGLAKPYRKVIFVATTGRSGTGTLHGLFDSTPRVVAFHEPRPVMHGRVMNAKNNGRPFLSRYVYANVKSNMILAENLRGEFEWYFEANHIFLKSFFEEVYREYGSRLIVICLYRDVLPTALSIYNLDAVPGKNRRGTLWYMDYRNSGNILRIEDQLEGELAHDFYKCLWYCYEIRARIRRYKAEYQDVEFIDVDMPDLNDYEKVLDLYTHLGIACDVEQVRRLIGKKHNTKKTEKVDRLEFAEAERMDARFRELLRETGAD